MRLGRLRGRVASGASPATAQNLGGSSTGTTGSPTTLSVTLNGAVPVGGGTTTISAAGATLSTSTLTWTFGGATSQNFTVQRATDGTTSVSITNSMGLTNGSALNYTSSTPASTGTPQPFTLTSGSSGSLPFAIGYAMSQGHVPSGSSLSFSGATAKLVVKATWPDGSAKHGIIAGTYTSAGSAVTMTPTVATVSAGTPLTGAAVQAAMGSNTAVIDCGSFGTATWTAADFATPFLTHAATDGFINAVYRKPVGSDAHLVAWLEVRHWPGQPIEFLPWIENGYLNVASPTNKSATYSFTLGGTSRFSAAIDLPNHCRTPLVSGSALSHWLGTDPAVVPTHDKPYLQATRLVPSYRATVPPASAPVTVRPSTYTPLQQGDYSSGMGSAGYHPSIGLLPEWDVIYLTTTAASMWGVVQRNAYSAGRFGIHYRDEATNRPLRFSSYPNLVMGGGSAVSGSGASTTSSYTPTATGTSPATYASTHHPSMGYMAYLLTGRFYHLETAQFVATINFLKNGNGPRQGSAGIFDSSVGANTTRGAAWAIRSLAQAAAITPDSDSLAAEFRSSLASNVSWYHGTYVAQPNNPQGFVKPYSDYTPPVVATTEAGSTTTAIVLPAGYVYLTDGAYNGQELVINGQTRIVSGYVGATRTATVSPAFTVTVASQPFELRADNVYYEAIWMQDFFTAALGYALAMPATLGTTALDKLSDLFAWKAQSVVGRFGSKGLTEYLYRDAGVYNLAVAPSNFPDWDGGTGPWFKSWGEVYTATMALLGSPGSRVDGDIRGTSGSLPTDTTGYWANLLPALCYAVEHKAAGAYAAYLGLTTSTSWATQAADYNNNPVWGVKPPTEPTVPAWVPSATTFANVGLNTLHAIRPSGWPSNDVGGPIINWCGGVFAADYSGFGATTIYGSGHLALPTDPLWAGVNHFNWDTLLFEMSNVPAAPTSDSTGYNTYGESTESATAGHLTTPHTYDGLSYRPRTAGGGKKGGLRHHFFPGTPFDKVVHEFDLNSPTSPPARKVTGVPTGGGAAGQYAMVASDASRRCDWVLANNGSSPMCQINWDTGTVTQHAVGYLDYGDHSMVHIPAPWDCLLAGGRSNSGNTDSRWYVCPIVNGVPTGFTEITPSGTEPTDGRTGMVFDPQQDKLVMHVGGSGGVVVNTLTPPSPGGSLTTGWAWGSVTLTGAGGISPAWAINTNSGGPYDNNGTWSKFQRVPITPSLSVYSHVGTITQTMQAWRPF